MAGEAVRLLNGFGRRYAFAMRLAILPPVIVVALLGASSERFAGTALMVAVAAVWTFVYGWWLGRDGTVPAVVDGAVLLVLCLSVFWTDAAATSNSDWLRVLVTIACVTWQWHTTPVTGFAVAVVATVGMVTIFAVAGLSMNGLPGWTIVMAIGSRAAWELVARAGERADRTSAEAEQARREAAVAAAERAEERELANSLHDTAATTLLMVGTGQVPSDASWLAPQARRDLDRLRSYDGKATE